MSGINAQELRLLNEYFHLDMGDPERNPQPHRAQEIKEKLAKMGLDLNDNATYELLEDGLTKQKFDDLEF